MRAGFIESTEFTTWVSTYLPDATVSQLQQELMKDPDKGDLMQGCGGLRKVRIADPRRRKGKRGGARVIYLYCPEAHWFFLLDVYGKDEKDDLSAPERKELAKLAQTLKREASQAAKHGRKRS